MGVNSFKGPNNNNPAHRWAKVTAVREIYLDLMLMLSAQRCVPLWPKHTQPNTHIHVTCAYIHTKAKETQSELQLSVRAEDINTKVVMSAAWMIPLLSQAINYQRHQCSNPVPGAQNIINLPSFLLYPPSHSKGLRLASPIDAADIISYFYLFLSPLSVVKSWFLPWGASTTENFTLKLFTMRCDYNWSGTNRKK